MREWGEREREIKSGEGESSGMRERVGRESVKRERRGERVREWVRERERVG